MFSVLAYASKDVDQEERSTGLAEGHLRRNGVFLLSWSASAQGNCLPEAMPSIFTWPKYIGNRSCWNKVMSNVLI